jgi:hypothetical protein
MYRVKLKRKIGRFFSKIEVVSHAQKRNDFFLFSNEKKVGHDYLRTEKQRLRKKNLTRHQATQSYKKCN